MFETGNRNSAFGCAAGVVITLLVAAITGAAIYYHVSTMSAVERERQSVSEKLDASRAEVQELEASLAKTTGDLERMTGEYEAIQPTFSHLICDETRPILPPDSYINQDALSAYLSDYIHSLYPGAAITNVEVIDLWNEDDSTYWAFSYSWSGVDGYLYDFYVYAYGGENYRTVNGIYSVEDQCFIAGPELPSAPNQTG